MSDEHKPQQISEKMIQLRGRYIIQINERLKELIRFRDIARIRAWHAEEQEALLFVAHKLAGSGTVFGFPMITMHGHALEKALRYPDAETASEQVQLLDQLIIACEAAKG